MREKIIMGGFRINKSGSKEKVHESVGSSTQVGTLYNNEVFAWTGTFAGSHAYYPSQADYVAFRGSGGVLKEGVIFNDGKGESTSILNYSFGNVTGPDGKTYKSFKTRATLRTYNAKAQATGWVPNGATILTNDSEPGQTLKHCMRAMWYKGPNSTKWEAISGVSGVYGFVDTGLLSCGSDAGKIGIYGNW